MIRFYLFALARESDEGRGDGKPQLGGTRPGIVMRTVNKKLPPRQAALEVVSLFALPSRRLSLFVIHRDKLKVNLIENNK